MSNDTYFDHITNTPLADIDLDTLPDFDTRNAKGEFKGMTNDEIKHRYIQEAIDQQQDDDLQAQLDELDD